MGQPRPTSPSRIWREVGITVAYGSDSGFPPFVAFAQMTDPANPRGVSRRQAIGFLSTEAAFSDFTEAEVGRIMPCMLADTLNRAIRVQMPGRAKAIQALQRTRWPELDCSNGRLIRPKDSSGYAWLSYHQSHLSL